MEDKQIIRLFQKRDETAIRLVEESYGNYCASIVRQILPLAQDVEEVLSDTWLRVWESIPPQEPKYLKLYLARIARNLAFDRFRHSCREKRGGRTLDLALEELAVCIPSAGSVGDRLAAEELKRSIDLFLQTLPARERSIFLRRYFFVEDTRTIAKRFRLGEGNVRTILTRIRKKLKSYLEQEGYFL